MEAMDIKRFMSPYIGYTDSITCNGYVASSLMNVNNVLSWIECRLMKDNFRITNSILKPRGKSPIASLTVIR